MQKTFALIPLLLLTAFGVAAQSRLKLEPCEVPGVEEGQKEKVQCGGLDVYENRVAKKGRKIRLNIVVFPATGPGKESDALFYIPGGPGSSATEDAPYLAKDFSRIREKRDLVFVDQRGTGGSNPLVCEFFSPLDLQSYLGHWNPPEQVRTCRERLAKIADLRLYVTTIAMDDLDEVREALGYGKINLYGGSYGTRAVQTYIKRHGENVRAAVLHGVSPPDQFMPRDFPQHTQRALEGVLAECLADAPCKAAFPNVHTDMRSVLEKLKRGPVEVEIKAPADRDRTVRVSLSRDLAGEAVRYMLYQSGAASRIPLVLSSAAKGDFAPLAEAALFYRQQIVATGATGLYIAITCAEDLPFANSGGIGKRKADDATFLGDYRLRQQLEVCSEWPKTPIERSYAQPVRSNVPVLILTGEWDPVTPPLYGERVAKTLPNSLHVVVPSGGHGFGGLSGLECIDDLTTDFIRSGTTRVLNISCVKSIRRTGFRIKPPEPPK